MLAMIPPATVLLVEDQEPLRLLASRILERGGFRVLATADGDAALAALEEHPDEVNVLLSDVVMPDFDGVMLAQAVRSRFPRVKIILMSGYGEERLTELGAQQWVDMLVLKPFTPESLVAAVRRAA
ncbi:MAG TPA: response regulator [Gemmatimonadaceae bacterium]|nr:response regulator [Gemmatimonadaceae bacterium]